MLEDRPKPQREAFQQPPIQGLILTFQWLLQVPPEYTTGISSLKLQFSKIAKSNLNLMVKPKDLITNSFS